MAKFKVGDRVRLARPYQPKYAGITGIIEWLGEGQLVPYGSTELEGWNWADCSVLWDGENVRTWQEQDQLEPILPVPPEEDILEAQGLPEFSINARELVEVLK